MEELKPLVVAKPDPVLRIETNHIFLFLSIACITFVSAMLAALIVVSMFHSGR